MIERRMEERKGREGGREGGRWWGGGEGGRKGGGQGPGRMVSPAAAHSPPAPGPPSQLAEPVGRVPRQRVESHVSRARGRMPGQRPRPLLHPETPAGSRLGSYSQARARSLKRNSRPTARPSLPEPEGCYKCSGRSQRQGPTSGPRSLAL